MTVADLKSVGAENFSAFDGITLTLKGGAADNFSDLTITGGANNVRRVIWSGEVADVQREAVLIVDNDGDGTLKGGWLILGNEQNVLTYYTDAAKISEQEDAAITLQFPDKKSALTPRRFTFMPTPAFADAGIFFRKNLLHVVEVFLLVVHVNVSQRRIIFKFPLINLRLRRRERR